MKYRPSPRYAAIVDKVMACGHWVDGEQVIGSHNAILVNSKTGATISYSLHDGGNSYNSERNFARDATKACGCQFLEVRGRKSSRKAVKTSGFDPSRAASENRQWADRWGGDVTNLFSRLDRAIEEMRELAAHPCRTSATKATSLLSEIRRLEDQLARFGQSPKPFDLTDLGEDA